MLQKYDICVIGAGSGGLSITAAAAQLGLNVVLIEKGEMGGDCLNTGCVPSKALLAAAKRAHDVQKTVITKDSSPEDVLNAMGVTSKQPDIDYMAVQHHVAEVIAGIAPHDSVERFEGLGAKVIKGRASFIDKDTVSIDGTDITVTAKKFVIATGSAPFIPPIKGLENSGFVTNEEIFSLPEQPNHLIVIGGGPIGVEMAQAHRRLGSDVTIITDQKVLPRDDAELSIFVRQSLEKDGIQMIEHAHIKEIKGASPKVTIDYTSVKDDTETAHKLSGSHILLATGRRAALSNLGLAKAGIQYTNKGITVDAKLRCVSRKHIYAVGDCVGGPQFTHIAGYHAGIVVKNMLFKIAAKVDYRTLPYVTYTDPELAQTGLTEAQAIAQYGPSKITVLRFSFKENDRARATRKTNGMIKIIAFKKGFRKNRIIGAGIVGENAGELIQLWTLAIHKNLKIADIATYISPYPTLGEISKRVAGSYYTPTLFSEKTQKIVKFLFRF